jgi:tRNA threonylcarbamoyladenosine biosynthesis protein TsaE
MAERQILEKISNSEETTLQIGGEFAATISLEKEAFVALDGDLGAGKTAFVRGMAGVLCPGARVCSPTYTVMRMYEGEDCTLYHFDMYRITSPEDLESVGFYDCVGIVAAEWCSNTPYALPDSYYRVTIEKLGENERRIVVSRVCKDE